MTTKKVLFIVGEEYEDIELLYPYYRVMEEGYVPVIAWKEAKARLGSRESTATRCSPTYRLRK